MCEKVEKWGICGVWMDTRGYDTILYPLVRYKKIIAFHSDENLARYMISVYLISFDLIRFHFRVPLPLLIQRPKDTFPYRVHQNNPTFHPSTPLTSQFFHTPSDTNKKNPPIPSHPCTNALPSTSTPNPLFSNRTHTHPTTQQPTPFPCATGIYFAKPCNPSRIFIDAN
jgi:hypothetical protein